MNFSCSYLIEMSVSHFSSNLIICWPFFLTDNKDKCYRHTQHAWTCQACWSKVRRILLRSLLFRASFKNISVHLHLIHFNGTYRILLTSTSEVYGDPLVHPQPETYWGNVNPIGKSIKILLDGFSSHSPL